MAKSRKKKPVKLGLGKEQILLLQEIINRLDFLWFWTYSRGVLSSADENFIKEVKVRLEKKLRKEKIKDSDLGVIDPEVNERFLYNLEKTLDEYIKNQGFNDDYGKRLAMRTIRIAAGLRKIMHQEENFSPSAS